MIRLITLLALLWVVGCATPRDAAVEREDEVIESRPISTDWVRIDQVRDFRVLDDSNLVLYAPTRRQAFHVELMPPCRGLRFSDTIALRGRMERLGGFAGDSVIIQPGLLPQRCPVSSVRRLSETELTELLVRFEGEAPGEPADDETQIELPQGDEEEADGPGPLQ